MKIPPFSVPDRFNLATLAPAFVLTLLPGCIHPQRADAQRAGITGSVGFGPSAVFVILQQSPASADGSDQSYRVAEHNARNDHNARQDAGQDAALTEAISDIETAFNKQDVHLLSRHVQRDKPVVVYVRGKFFYSLDGDNYLSMTRDAQSATKTVSFVLDRAQPKGNGAYTLTGHHTYTDRAGKSHTVAVTYVLEKSEDRYYIAQVDTVPAKLPDSSPNTEAKRPQAPVSRVPVIPASPPPPVIPPDIVRQSPPPASPQRSLSPPGRHACLYTNGTPRYRLVGSAWGDYFPAHAANYSHYALHYYGGFTAFSPYYYFSGIVPPYIAAVSAINQPPPTVFVPYPLYAADGSYQGKIAGANGGQRGRTSIEDATRQDALLANAIADLDVAWNRKDGRAMSRHIDRDMPVAVYMRGKYFYSLDGDDYLSITRDALATEKSVSFTLDTVQHSARDIYTLNGHHTYADQAGKSHVVLVSYVLAKEDDDYYLTQVGVSPEKLEK